MTKKELASYNDCRSKTKERRNQYDITNIGIKDAGVERKS
jgi:hypothetical protein